VAIPLPKTQFKFDGRNQHAQAVAARQAARYVTRVSDETRQAINTLIVRAIRDNITPSETSRLLRSVVGLTSQSTAAVVNYYEGLVERGETPAAAQRYADKYAGKLLGVRAETIARTEIMGALNAGALESARQRQEAGLFREPMKRWTVTPDEATCHVCRPLHGETVQLHQVFSVGVLAPPAHPRCRCSVTFFERGTERELPPVAPTPGDWNLQGEARQVYAQELLERRRSGR
jgi:SPP1 gp7 family putative phage head morphogenesis protein